MPIYEYRCKPCERSFETLRTLSQKDEPTPCPSCGTPTKTRLLSMVAAHVSADGAGACATSAALNMPCCGGGCGLPMRR
ncbi:FmdB family zinc ribbon protein [Armatimonas rosea]|uniref:Putative FmdB family regulatory protein n=1 Tax=Armatimonas rosea TaxID=685828 RepID=A0A7W9W4A9_ARMRO|nr:zinc ribbon domain-containing protein [Armatimonas rosea]MBB6049249.1 putative FmdB family regulatory protein [Armatimonas rosea]